jgi:glycosyltransferase involved in cell wall biosynthesis
LEPRVTIIVTQRERASLAERSFESVIADRSEPFNLIYIKNGGPASPDDYLVRHAGKPGFMLISPSHWLWPNEARNLALPHVGTEYVAFVDNDVIVETGWLKTLVACANETHAALVGPIYLYSDGLGEPLIHMAGGTLTEVETPQGTALHEHHERLNAPASDRAQLRRGKCDFLEYHGMVARTNFIRSLGGLNEEIVCVHEHIDIALEAKRAGLPVVFEPAAAITQLAHAPHFVTDLAFHRWRWSRAAAEQSMRAFLRKWNVVDDGEALKGVRGFVDGLTAAIDPLVPHLDSPRPKEPLAAAGIRQSLYGLLTHAADMGYAKADLELFASAYHAAMTMFADGFRPCARPFISHCAGTGSALIAFGFAPRIVVAGILHAAYTHAPLGPQPNHALHELKRQLRTTFGERVECLIRNYTRMQIDQTAWCTSRPLESLTLDEAEVVAIAVANSIDECAAGEPLFSAKAPPTTAWIAYVHRLAEALGVPAFAQTLSRLADEPVPAGFDMRRPHGESFRHVRGGIARMAHGAFPAWDASSNTSPSSAKRTA